MALIRCNRGPRPDHFRSMTAGIFGPLLVVLMFAAGGCAKPPMHYESSFPKFVLEAPGDWYIQAQGRAAGQELALTPRAEPREDDPLILVHFQRVDDLQEMLPGHYQIDLQVDPGWRGRRYIVFRSPLAPIVEVYAPEKKFEATNRLAANIAQQLARQFALPDDLRADPSTTAPFLPPTQDQEQ